MPILTLAQVPYLPENVDKSEEEEGRKLSIMSYEEKWRIAVNALFSYR